MTASYETTRSRNIELPSTSITKTEFTPARHGFLRLSRTFRILSSSPEAARFLGFDSQSIVGKRLTDLTKPTRTTWEEIFRRITLGVPTIVEVLAGDRPLDLCLGTDGNIEDYVPCLIRDAEPRHLIARAIERRERLAALGDATAGAAHEINNALTSLLQILPLIDYPGIGVTERSNHIGNLTQAANRAAELVATLLRKVNEWEDDPVLLDPAEVATEVLDLRRARLAAQGLSAVIDSTAHAPRVHIRRASLECILLAMFAHAARAVLSGAHERQIVVEIRDHTDRMIRISVPAMGPAEILDWATPNQGTAEIALPPARWLAEEAKGALDLEISPEGEPQLVLLLPRPTVREEQTIEIEPAPREASTETLLAMRGLTILVVDDEKFLRQATARLLRLHGATTVEAANGEDALAAIEEAPETFDAILLDIRLPRKSGRQVYQALKESNPEIAKRVIFMVGDRVEGEMHAFLTRTGRSYLTKPWTTESLLSAIHGVVAMNER